MLSHESIKLPEFFMKQQKWIKTVIKNILMNQFTQDAVETLS